MRLVGTRLDQPRNVERPVNLMLDQRGALPGRWVALSKLGHVWVAHYMWNVLDAGTLGNIWIDPFTNGKTLDFRFEVKTSGFGIVTFREDPTVVNPGIPFDPVNMNRNFQDNTNETLLEYDVDELFPDPELVLTQEYCGGWYPHVWEWRFNRGRTYLVQYEDQSNVDSIVSMVLMFTEE